MADADEDAIRLPSCQNSVHIETDLSDETQDFRFLNNLSLFSDQSQATLPRRGEKDFEPNPTLYQADILAASRQAMHNALAYPRLHHPRNKVVGYYAPEGPAPPRSYASNDKTTGEAVDGDQTSKSADASEKLAQSEPTAGAGIGVFPHACVYVTSPKGQYFRTMGRGDRWNRIWLLPEEALYLLERGSLDIRWPSPLTGDSEENGNKEQDDSELLPMSLQAAYTCLMGRGGLTLERYLVYTGLRRLGYTLIRAPSWDETSNGTAEGDSSVASGNMNVQQPQTLGLFGLLGRLFQWIRDSDSTASTAAGPVVGLGIHRSYNDIYRKLSMIPYYDPAAIPDSPTRYTIPPFRIAFHVYKPSTPFRKTAPPAPDFRIAVVNCRTQTSIPTASQLGALLENTPLDPPRGEKMDRMLYMRLRHGYRNVILAVVDQGVVSYLRIADAAFGKEKIYEHKTGPTSKSSRKGGPPRSKTNGR